MLRACLAALAASLIACAASAAPRPMTAADLVELEQVSDPRVSPDGRTVLYSLGRADWKADEVVDEIWRIGIDGAAPRRMVQGPASDARWAPDGRSFAFVAKRAGDSRKQIYVSPIDGGEPRRVGSRRTTPMDLRWSSDGTSLYFLADAPEPKAEREARKGRLAAFEDPGQRRVLWRMSVADGKVRRVVGGDDFDVEAYDLSRDGRSILYRRAPSKLNDDNPKAELWLKRQGQADRRLTDNDYQETNPRLSPDGRSLLFLATAEGGRYATVNPNLFMLDLADGEIRELGEGLGWEIEAAEWAADGRAVYISATTGVRRELFALDRAGGAPRPLARGDHSASEMSLSDDGRTLVFLLASARAPAEAYRLDTGRPEPVAVTRVHAGLGERFQLPRQETIRWKAADGQELEGLVTYPVGWTPGRRYPLIVQTHGGPRSADVFNIFAYGRFNPVLATQGFMTLSVNYRGGTGYGDAFLQGMNAGYFRHADSDVLSGVDHLVSLGLADPQRLGAMGWSAGGHITNRMVTVTDRFKAVASGAGAVDWPSMYLTSDTRWQRTEWFVTPPYGTSARRDLYVDHSPLAALDRVRTPVLILAGEDDERVPASQSVMLYRALKALGVETELYLAPGEPHNFRKLRHRLFQINVQMDWFARRVTGTAYEATWAPGDSDDDEEASPTGS